MDSNNQSNGNNVDSRQLTIQRKVQELDAQITNKRATVALREKELEDLKASLNQDVGARGVYLETLRAIQMQAQQAQKPIANKESGESKSKTVEFERQSNTEPPSKSPPKKVAAKT